jgi:hypothetical protein
VNVRTQPRASEAPFRRPSVPIGSIPYAGEATAA